ncbi:oxidoreductase [Cytophagales bacterium WSM2-2]|nr:oxidoreductase [Cytophagales bacterium WSM2-2]
MPKTALVAGSTGLIGNQLLQLLLNDEAYTRVIAISRRKLSIENSKLINVVCELNQLNDRASELKADDVFCCLGTTMKQARSKEAFRTIDLDAPLALAKISKSNGVQNFLLISALGASKRSSVFYNQVKGEVEELIGQMGFNGYHIFRPSLLFGPRTEQRSGEDAAKVFFKIFGWLVPKKYKAIESIKVARAMLAFAKRGQQGSFVHESGELQSY